MRVSIRILLRTRFRHKAGISFVQYILSAYYKSFMLHAIVFSRLIKLMKRRARIIISPHYSRIDILVL